MRPVLVEMLEHATDGLDDFLTNTNRAQNKADIWSNMDEQDIDLLADTFLKLGHRSSVAAGVVRAGAQGYMNARALLLILPRLYATAFWYPRNGGLWLEGLAYAANQ